MTRRDFLKAAMATSAGLAILNWPVRKIQAVEKYSHSVEFIQGRFFGRVLIQDKTEEGLKTAERFGSRIVTRIKALQKD